MDDDSLPKWLLFEEILTTRPFHESRLLWREAILWDAQRMGLDTLRWYEVVQGGIIFTKPLCPEELLGVSLWSLAVGELLIVMEI